ncbi:MAG: spermidine/putrescine ABC transporter substrate-binding protein [Dermatophilaceae bacterium]
MGRRTLLGLAAAALAGCSGEDGGAAGPTTTPTPTASPTPTPTFSTAAAEDRALVWATWPDYIDVDDDGGRPTLAAFTAQSGIPVEYEEVIEDNDTYVDSVRGALEAGEPIGADIVTLTTWMAATLVQEGRMQPFVTGQTAGRVIPALAAPAWDPDQAYSIPWQAGLTGIAYDARAVDRAIGSVNELLTREDLQGRIGLLTDFSDTVGMALLARGVALPTATEDDVADVIAGLREQQEQGAFVGFYGNEYLEALTDGSVVASLAWSGDILQAQVDNPYLKFVVPEEGLVIWADNLLVPAGSAQAEAAGLLADYYYRPDVAAQVAAWVNYICPVVGAQEAMEALDPDLAANPFIFPDRSTLDRSFQLPPLEGAAETTQRAAFAELIAGGAP